MRFVPDALGTIEPCETCKELKIGLVLSTNLVSDYWQVEVEDDPSAGYLIVGNKHFFCDKHVVEPTVTRLIQTKTA